MLTVNESSFTVNDSLKLTSEFCADFSVLPIFYLLTLIFLSVSLISVVVNGLFIVSVWKTKIFHINIRLLLTNITATFFGISYTLIGQAIYNFKFSSLGYYSRPAYTTCFVLKLLFSTCMPMTAYSMILVGLERWYSTFKSQMVAENERPSKLMILICLACWIFSLGGVLARYNPRGQQDTVCYCDGIVSSTVSSFIMIRALALGLEAGALLLFVGVLYKSRRHYVSFSVNRAVNHNLAERFHTWHNIQIMELLMAVMKMELATKVATFAVSIAASILYGQSYVNVCINLLQVYYVLIALETCLYPYVCVRNNDHINHKLVSMLSCAKRKLVAFCVGDAETTQVSTVSRHMHKTLDHRISPEQQNELLESTWLKMSQSSDKKSNSTDYSRALKFNMQQLAIVVGAPVRGNGTSHNDFTY